MATLPIYYTCKCWPFFKTGTGLFWLQKLLCPAKFVEEQQDVVGWLTYTQCSQLFPFLTKIVIVQSYQFWPFFEYTMFQTLLKCEFKAWLCWRLMILLPLWFYVKSNLSEFKQSKNVIFGNFRYWTLNLW